MSIDSSYFDKETYFSDSTEHVKDFIDSFIDVVVPVWQDYEQSLILTSMNAILNPGAAGAPLSGQLSVSIGSLVGTKQFKGILDEFPDSFVENGFITPHMEHFLKAIDLSLMLTMNKWATFYTMNGVPHQFTTLQVPPWTPPPGAVPGVLASQIGNNDLKFNKGSSNLDVKDELQRQIINFMLNRQLFSQKTDYLREFVEKLSEMFAKAVQNWEDSVYISGGNVIVVYINPGNVVGTPIFVAHNVS